jgi:hypothetical protein
LCQCAPISPQFRDCEAQGLYRRKITKNKIGDFRSIDSGEIIEKGDNVLIHAFSISGNVQATENKGSWAWIWVGVIYSEIGGDLQVTKNEVENLDVRANTVGGNLKVKNNTPKATVSGNDVTGNEEVD